MSHRSDLACLPTLGVGMNYQPSGFSLMKEQEWVDFIEVCPDTLCDSLHYDSRSGSELVFDPDRLSRCLEVRRFAPMVVHGLGLSIGSASGMNQHYLHMLERLQAQLDFPWHSEHLGFTELLTEEHGHIHAGTQLPVPFTRTVVEMLAERIAQIRARFARPFLLENTAHYLTGLPSDKGMDEIGFLNQLCEASGCGLVLDVFNLYCNATNFGFSALDALKRLDLAHVVEVHVAGGVSHKQVLMDVHCRTVPEPVWALVAYVLERGVNVKALTFELLEQAYEDLGAETVRAQLQRARAYWSSTKRLRTQAA